MSTKALLFIPCYNCATQIPRVFQQLKNPELVELVDQVLFVENKSTDSTPEVINELISSLSIQAKLIQNEQNYGLGGSHKVAFSYAIDFGFDYVIILHGDDQASIADALELFKRPEVLKCDLILGARFHKNSKLQGYSLLRSLGNRFFNNLASLLTRKNIPDLGGSGLNIFKVSAIKNYHERVLLFSNDLTFHIHLLLLFIREKRKIYFFPISWREEDQKSNVKSLSQTLAIIKILLSFFLSKKTYTKTKKSNIHYTYRTLYDSEKIAGQATKV